MENGIGEQKKQNLFIFFFVESTTNCGGRSVVVEGGEIPPVRDGDREGQGALFSHSLPGNSVTHNSPLLTSTDCKTIANWNVH